MPLIPTPLRADSVVRVLSPAGPVTTELLSEGLDVLRSWGLHVEEDHRLYHASRYLAGSDHERLGALNDALRDPTVDAILFSRGGYGSMRLLDDVDWSALRERPRPIVGFSDITAIHLAALRHADVMTIHGHVVKSFATQAHDLPAQRAALFGERDDVPVAVDRVRSGRANGRMIGGNLSLVCSLLASRHLPPLEGAVLFLEDVTEPDYRLDRLFTTLRLALPPGSIAAVVLGEFTSCGGVFVADDEVDDHVRQLGRELGDALDVPVVAAYPSGHGSRNVPFLHGGLVEVDADEGVVNLSWSDRAR